MNNDIVRQALEYLKNKAPIGAILQGNLQEAVKRIGQNPALAEFKPSAPNENLLNLALNFSPMGYTKVAPEVTNVAKSIVSKIPKKFQPLAEEARKFYHGSPIANLKDIGFGEGVRSNPFLGTSKQVKSNAIFFTEDPKVAQTFAENRVEWLGTLGKSGKATVYERKLNIKNPADFTNLDNADIILEKAGISAEREILGLEPNFGLGEYFSDLVKNGQAEPGDLFRLFDDPKIIAQLKKVGYDGAILNEKGFKAKTYVVFDPKSITQATKGVEGGVKNIKSAIGQLKK